MDINLNNYENRKERNKRIIYINLKKNKKK